MGTSQTEKVYVAIGTDQKEGYATLEWALRKWSSQSVSIVILHADNNKSKDFVYTPFGKLPASYVSDEKLEVLRKIKEGENDNFLSEYKALCGKIKVEVLKIEKHDEPLHKLLVELISGIRITKLVVGFTFMKSSSWKSRGAISGSFYVHRHKPEFCELFIVCGGKLLFLREDNNEGFIEDDQGVIVAKFKEKGSFRGWLGKKLNENGNNEKFHGSPSPVSSSTRNGFSDQWENCVQEIESYFNQLLSSNSDEEGLEVENDTLRNSQREPEKDIPEIVSDADKIERLKIKITSAQNVIQLKRKEAKANVERHARAEWAICLCTRRAEEIEAQINEEIDTRTDLKKELDTTKEEVCEIGTEVEDKKSKLKSMLELQRELSNKLQLSSLAKTRAEAQLEKAVTARAEMVREIEELRRQREIEFTADEIRAATDDFSERLRLKSAGDWTNVYRGRINHIIVAIKAYNSVNGLSQEAFEAKVKLLSQMRHPHIVAMIGYCSELRCIAFEYMSNGCLRDVLFSVSRSSRRRNRSLNWHTRVRVAAQVCSALGFLHSAQPRSISHGNLNPSKILLDRNLVAKIHGLRLSWCHGEVEVQSDMKAFGNLVLQLLTGRNWAGLVEEEILIDRAALSEVLDDLAGEWPLDLAVELAKIAMRCLSANKGLDTELSMAMVMREIEKVRKKADDLVSANGEGVVAIEGGGGANIEDSTDVPSVFLCPIFQVGI
ncbi:hypothetical protein TEA_026861 [Camellia sinensis var. sinensis]|uniref:RING-type E3 ubiquitin transferase n=1 Tax=Camellia sinensis var. sinensis TaxID=542762 RepID=A0A4S4EAK7_CAMSN|nr:hypothetical protein TEA_026861 [Camellia sinensis var. sinensis]